MRKAGAVKTRERKKHRPQMPAVDTPPANQPAKTSAKIPKKQASRPSKTHFFII